VGKHKTDTPKQAQNFKWCLLEPLTF